MGSLWPGLSQPHPNHADKEWAQSGPPKETVSTLTPTPRTAVHCRGRAYLPAEPTVSKTLEDKSDLYCRSHTSASSSIPSPISPCFPQSPNGYLSEKKDGPRTIHALTITSMVSNSGREQTSSWRGPLNMPRTRAPTLQEVHRTRQESECAANVPHNAHARGPRTVL